jgi:hypothetical protein
LDKVERDKDNFSTAAAAAAAAASRTTVATTVATNTTTLPQATPDSATLHSSLLMTVGPAHLHSTPTAEQLAALAQEYGILSPALSGLWLVKQTVVAEEKMELELLRTDSSPWRLDDISNSVAHRFDTAAEAGAVPPFGLAVDVPDVHWDWTDAGQIQYRDIERIHVHDPHARQKVTDARLNGVPVCITGHCGWAQFTQCWLCQLNNDNNHHSNNHENTELLDLSQPHEVDVAKMIADVGTELVPVIRKNYEEENPIHAQMTIETF